MNKLKFLAMAKDFTVKDCGDSYEITMFDSDLAAIIGKSDSNVDYYLIGCYNSGIDWLSINVADLEKLKAFCELMVE